MKKQLYFILGLIAITFMANAQAPQAIPYQGVARNAMGSVIKSQAISLRISIHDLTATGMVAYSETHSVTTSSLGLINLNIGSGNIITGTMGGITWGVGAKFLQVELDPLGGSSFVDMGTTQLNSVPYALFSSKTEGLPDGFNSGNTLHWNGTAWIADNSIFNDGSKVGIGTGSPQTALDIKGDIATGSADIIVTTTYNYALDVNSVKQNNYRLLQNAPIVGNFIIAGITGAGNGRLITLSNRSGSSMEIYNDDASASPNDRIITGTGTTFAIYNGGSVTLRYDGTGQKWEVINSHYNSLDYFGGAGGSSYWNLNGNDIINSNPGNIGIGVTSPGRARLEVNGIINSPNTIAIFGGDGNGVSIQRNWPTIGFNQYRDNATGYGKAIADGYGSHLTFNPQLGYIQWVVQDSVGANNSFAVLPKNAISIFKNAAVHIGNNNVTDQASLSISGGSGFPSHFNYGSGGHTYIRGGNKIYGGVGVFSSRRPSKVYINDQAGENFSNGAQVAGGDVIMVTGGGNVGIGTENTTGYRLAVNGLIRSKEIVVETGWADYVFADDYKLPSLEYVAQHISLYKHLPGIPSAAEIQENGLKLGDLQTKMMAKIEELTLYIIEADKKIKILEERIQLDKK